MAESLSLLSNFQKYSMIELKTSEAEYMKHTILFIMRV